MAKDISTALSHDEWCTLRRACEWLITGINRMEHTFPVREASEQWERHADDRARAEQLVLKISRILKGDDR